MGGGLLHRDFKNEASNMIKMKQLLKGQGVTDVIAELIKIGQECFLIQLLQVGFFHSDPHPGNLMKLNDPSKGKLALLDFGLVASIQQEDMDTMVSSIIHLANKDYPSLVDDFINLKILPTDC